MRRSGTVTFLLTDVERSTQLWETAPKAAAGAMARHRALLDAAVRAHDGVRPEEQGEGDSVVAAFASAADAVAAAVDIQRTLAAEDWPDGTQLRVRIGLHTGEAEARDERNFGGLALHRCARLRDIAHGGQTVMSSVTAAIVADALPDDARLVDRGVHRLRDLSRPEQVFELRPADLTTEFPPLRSLDAVPNNLRALLTSFVGRRQELEAVTALLGRPAERLVTLTGSGGSGKTRLAAQVAADLADRWPDGVWWVELAPITDPAGVAELIASTLRVLVEPGGGPLRALRSQLRDRRLLLCLDNCEHLRDASAELVDTLLRACPHLWVVATSREALGVAGETVWRVPSLTIDDAAQLFAERAARVRPGFALDPDNEAAVRTICRRLDGIPLAVELAAAWVRTLTAEQIVTGLDDRFRLLAGGPWGVAPRHQTLAASLAWSYDLLDETDRVVFRRLAVFAGGFTLEGVQAVGGADPLAPDDVLPALRRLIDKSLVQMDDQGREARYGLLETIRQYARERLDEAAETAAVRDRHLDHFMAVAETSEPELEAADQDRWLAELEIEHDNLRAALDWGLSKPQAERGRRLAAALPQLWMRHGHTHDGVQWLRRAIDRGPADRSTLQARLLVGASLVGGLGGQFLLAAQTAQQAVEIATANGDDRNRGRGLALQSLVQFFFDFAACRELGAEAQRRAEAAGDQMGADLALVLEGLGWANSDRHETSRPLLEDCFRRCQERGDRAIGAFALAGVMYAELFGGDVRRAVEVATAAFELAEPLGDYFIVGSMVSALVWAQGLAGRIDEARKRVDTLVRSVESAGADVDVPPMVSSVGKVHLWSGDLEGALRWFERGVRYAAPLLDNVIVARVLPDYAATLRHLGRLDEAREQADRAVRLTAQLGVPHARAEALDEVARLVASSQPDHAEDLHHQALAIRVEHGLRTFYVASLDALAYHAARVESLAEATRLLAASDTARESIGYPRPPIDRPDHDALVASLRADQDDDDFATLWAEGRTLTLDDAVDYVGRARGTRRRPSTGWASLTPTELKVVELVVQGLTNPEIGRRLFVSPGTVKTHLSHVYAKLGVANRTELATLAATHLTPN
ncbi:MAG: helix-turn-helix transcriptional regulator [Acidimicrobiales bacterium]